MKIAILLLLLPFQLLADTGFTYTGDLNGDGVDDYIKTGPSSLFGNGGGPCVLTVSIPNGEYKKQVIFCSRSGITLEQSTNKYQPARLWRYSHFNAGTGTISTVTLDGNFKKEFITLYATWSGADSIGTHILKAISDKGNHLKFKEHKNYTPPKHPCGVQWGKGC